MDNDARATRMPRVTRLALALASASAIATSSAALWLLSFSGTLGLVEWMPHYRNILLAIFFSGWIPLIPAIAGAILGRRRVARILIAAASVLATGTIALAGYRTAWYAVGIARSGKAERVALSANALQTRLSALAARREAEAASNPAASATPLLRIALSADPHYGNPKSDKSATARILDTANRNRYDAFFILGDVAEHGYPAEYLDAAARDLSRRLPDVPLATVMGNHDAVLGGETAFRARFTGERLWRADAGPIHLVAIDLLWGTESFTGADRAWLERTLSSIPRDDVTIVMTHAFFWSSGYVADSGLSWADNGRTIERVAPLFARYGVDLVVSGHNHFMEYLEPEDGVAYAIVGAMGGIPDATRTIVSKASRWFSGDKYGFIEVSAWKDRVELAFRDENGETIGAFTVVPRR